MKAKWIGLILALIGLGLSGVFLHKTLNNYETHVNHGLVPYVDEWKATMDIHKIEYDLGNLRTIDIVDTDKYFGRASYGDQSISISDECMETDVYTIKSVVWHELGHYVFGLEHDNDTLRIMNDEVAPWYETKENWAELEAIYLFKCEAKANNRIKIL